MEAQTGSQKSASEQRTHKRRGQKPEHRKAKKKKNPSFQEEIAASTQDPRLEGITETPSPPRHRPTKENRARHEPPPWATPKSAPPNLTDEQNRTIARKNRTDKAEHQPINQHNEQDPRQTYPPTALKYYLPPTGVLWNNKLIKLATTRNTTQHPWQASLMTVI